MMNDESVGPLIRNATPPQITAILGAMRAIAEGGHGSTKADEDALTGAAHYMFGYNGPLGVEAVPSIRPPRSPPRLKARPSVRTHSNSSR